MIISLYYLTVIAAILLPVLLAILLRRRARAPWRYFFVGIATFLGAQVVHLPLNKLLQNLGMLPTAHSTGPDLIQTAVILGLTAAVTEELARVVGYALVKPAREAKDAIMLGIGHGGIEAMLLGGVLVAASVSSLVHLQRSELLLEGLTAAQLSLLENQMGIALESAAIPLLALLERTLALAAHVVLSMLVWQAFARRNVLFVVVAIAYHAVVNAAAVFASAQELNPWLVEGIVALMILPGALWAWRLRPRRAPGEQTEPVSAASRRQLSSSLRKELTYQWRTRRVLIVGAVFLIMGMGSPLLARFTPQILSSVEGAEAFAHLIPEPSVRDAMQQYVGNLTQFGFVLVILLGMGAVAAEKEHGTAAMVLSKPLPRWAFLVAKYLTQAAVYAAAMLLAGLGAYYYTVVLFGDFPFGAFMLSTGLLLYWLLILAAVTLLGSALGKSTGAGAGIALLGAIALLLAGNIRTYGLLFPGGLVAWAGQAPLSPDVPANGGALAMGLVLIMLLVLGSVAAFEEQDI
jgi:ABC-2 type transport system permease protein